MPQNQPGTTWQAEDDEQRAALRFPGWGPDRGDQGPGLDRAPVFCAGPARNPRPFSTVEPRHLPPVIRTGVAEGIGGRELADVPGAGRAQKGRVSIELTQHALQTVVGHSHAMRRRPRTGRREEGSNSGRRATSAQVQQRAESGQEPKHGRKVRSMLRVILARLRGDPRGVYHLRAMHRAQGRRVR